ncbi:MAG: DUF1002 domain-containing protein [Lachnospiraceae bacterium]|nr:DUF1002 domain-containing protein [Lachnospiraceae bacterium]
MKKIICMLLVSTLVLATPMTVFATQDGIVTYESGEATSEMTEEEIADAIVENDNKPYLALGADLSEEQLQIVLDKMGIAKEDLEDYNVVYITNEEEHEYLDGYIDSSVIGTNALSCVMVKETDAGSGLRLTTMNINYCTINMYRNALITAGVENADILVVGPFPLSGTAALIGAMKAYEEMSGEELDEAAKTAALAELVVTGDVVSSGESEEEADKLQDVMDYVKAEVIAGDITDWDAILDIIENAEIKFDITLTDEQKEQIAALMQKIAELDIDPVKLLEQAGDLYDKYGETVLAEAKEILDGIFTEEVKASLWDSIKDFFSTLWNAITDFFTGADSSEDE